MNKVVSMTENVPDIEEYCDECGNEARMKFVKSEDEYLVYECSVCSSEHRFLREKIEQDYEDEWPEPEEEWEE